ncbi:MAG: bis(5'-nucleosyl)-tetraphosphatase (symmetrical) YqeK [Clostridia bacterium]|nr:bis(5'-nucleosyl)-tetraphosphatase (symmetrical) YqeK [Clostridia bacterium]
MKHVLAVEDMAYRLGLLYFHDSENLLLLRTAALLHDVTKELSDEEQLAILESHSVKPLPEELASMPTIHALTAALVIPDRFPEFSESRVIDAVRYHTTGREEMSIFEKLIFLADYIDDTRTYPSCISLRKEFFSSKPEDMNEQERIRHLDRAALASIDNTLSYLRSKERSIHPLTLEARADLKARLRE